MKHDPRPAIHIEKQIGWAHKFGRGNSRSFHGWSNSVSQVDGVSDMTSACQFCGSEGKGFRKETITSSCLDARYFSSSLYSTGAFQAATLALELRGSESE